MKWFLPFHWLLSSLWRWPEHIDFGFLHLQPPHLPSVSCWVTCHSWNTSARSAFISTVWIDLTKLTANCFYHSLTSFICRRYLGKSPWMLFLNKNKLAWGWKQYVLCTICIYRDLWRLNSLLNYDKFYRRLKICLLKIIDVYNTLRNKIRFLAKLTSWIHCFEFRAQSHIYYRILISH